MKVEKFLKHFLMLFASVIIVYDLKFKKKKKQRIFSFLKIFVGK